MARKGERRTADSKRYVAVVRKDPCSYCGGPSGTVDHIVPRAAHGENQWTNFTGACRDCNNAKKAKPLLLYLLTTATGL